MDLLQVHGDRIVDRQGRPIRLRGTCIGGWMNMENFINGFPGAEHGMRAALAEALGPAKAEFLCERWLDHFLTEDDIAFIAGCGANVVRLALNYRHFERDDRPFQYLEQGFRRLEQAVGWCARHGVYVVLDLHAAPGWQNPDWHCDNAGGSPLFWQHAGFQDRYVALWEELARRYAGNPAIAGYDLLNEPMTHRVGGPAQWPAIDAVYARVVRAIRAIDRDHILFLEGDEFGSSFDGLAAPPDDNWAPSGHSYSPACVERGTYPGWLNGRYWDRTYQVGSTGRHQLVGYARRHGRPLWFGEFGTVCNGPEGEREDRMRALDDQIDVFEEYGAHWTTWTYKDIGAMGWVTVDPGSEYIRRIAPILDAKAALHTDAWMSWLPPTLVQQQVAALARSIEGAIDHALCNQAPDRAPASASDRAPGPEPDPAGHEHLLARAVLNGHAANLLQPVFAQCFIGLSEAAIDRVLQSFRLEQCRVNTSLLDVLKRHLARPMVGPTR